MHAKLKLNHKSLKDPTDQEDMPRSQLTIQNKEMIRVIDPEGTWRVIDISVTRRSGKSKAMLHENRDKRGC
jgi:hypothetical protein